MKIPIDLTPYEFITGVSSVQRHDNNYYEIPDEIFKRIEEEIKRLSNG